MLLRVLSRPPIKKMKTSQTKKILVCTAASAFCSSSQAWLHTTTPPRSPREAYPPWVTATTCNRIPTGVSNTVGVASRTFVSSRRNDNDDDNGKSGGGFLAGLEKAAKSILPTKLFGTTEEKQKLAKRQQIEDEVSGGLDEMLKGAPLGIRMMGKMVAPLMGKVASTMAETMAEQQRSVEALLDDARGFLLNDPSATQILGTPIQVGTPFQQSSSTMNVNGKTQSRVELAFPVNGSKGSGVARLSASSQDGISQLLLEAGGRLITVSLTKTKFSNPSTSLSGRSSASGDDDDIIEAEIIEKKTK